jgi:uncharacterized OsmC-like protein
VIALTAHHRCMESRSLRHYLRQKRDAIMALATARPRGQDWREEVSATVTADDASGVRKLRIRDWQMIGDSGPGFGGWSLGPSSPELLCGVLATCLTHTYEIGAALLEVPFDRVEVRVAALNNDARFAGIETDDPATPWAITAHVSLEAAGVAPDRVAALHQYARERCPLSRLLRDPQEVTIVVA